MTRAAIDPYTGPWTYGIDVSAYQPDVDWPTVARSDCYVVDARGGPCRYAIVRTGDGIQTRRDSAPDPWAVRHLAGARDAGLLVGGYHYLRAHHGAAAQVDVMLEVLRVAGMGPRDCPILALDLEGRPDAPGTPSDESSGAYWRPSASAPLVTTARVLEVMAAMARDLGREGYRVLVYSGVTWHWYVAQLGIAVPPELAGLDLWTPYYTRNTRPRLPVGRGAQPWPWAHAAIWQAAGSEGVPGRVAGVRGRCDANRYRGDEAALRAWWTPVQLPAAEPPALPPVLDPWRPRALEQLAQLAAEGRSVGDTVGVRVIDEAAERLRAAAC